MNILWLADFNLHHNVGGAQRSDAIIIDEGYKLGHSIIPFNYDSEADLLSREYDLVVSANLENLHRRPEVMNFLLYHPNHVRLEHDDIHR